MKLAAGFAIQLLAMVASASAQEAPSAEDPRDRIAPKEMSYSGEPEPWWIGLADCAAVYRHAPEDRAKVQAFATAAMAQIAKDRGITVREAGAVVMPYVMSGRGHELAAFLVATYGGDVSGLREGCDGVMAKYKEL